ncbi:MAG: hypothetical protein CVU00_00665 [Bacteroidetes bacterium HGW-Bacteroidetes-17]|jgi:TonB-dependent SusC/RagA subfamily outer membrane receptor|nr:MAG: hypothetical protein CVU00_00665 [Bacteroidetes bacterium HGW-Bacteroidetes-17]
MKPKLAFLIAICLFVVYTSLAQGKKQSNKTVLKGLVTDTEGIPIQNASVFVDGKNCKVLSDADGLFELELKSGVKKIAVYTMPQGATEVAYVGQAKIIFVLPSSNKILADSLNEPKMKEINKVNTDYFNAHKKNLSKNVSEINKNTIKNADHYVTIYDMIRGEVAGVNVYGSTITIRGASSLVLSNEPLLLVNGMPVRSLDHISPSQVKSIKVLKGPSAAIYGARGANGVIVIDLKTDVDNH